MAKRPRPHRLEDESLAAFLGSRPSLWVARQKSSDYGIDVEVEIFDSEGLSTGSIFYVQLKATDATEGRELVLESDYLDDLCKYQSNTIIVRYFARDRALYWAWASDLRSQIPRGQKSKTFHFSDSDLLHAEAYRSIELAIRLGELLASLPSERPLPIWLDFGPIGGRRRLEIQRVFGRLEESSVYAIDWVEIQEHDLLRHVRTTFSDDSALVTFGPRYSLKVELDDTLPSDEIASRVLYGIATLLLFSSMSAHGARLARAFLELGIRSDSRPLALNSVKLLKGYPQQYVDLAILNRLHAIQDIAYIDALMGLYELAGQRVEIARHALRFLEAALEQAKSDGPHAEGAILYSMANAARKVDIAFAYRLYMQAKRKKPEYRETPYFIREVAGCLFFLGRFKLAAKMYIASGMESDSDLDNLLLSDCFLFAGDYENAIIALTEISEEPETILFAERSLKLWLADFLQAEGLPPCSPGKLFSLFNEGVALAQADDSDRALARFLVCCLIVPNDHESWLNALICAFSNSDSRLAAFVAIVGLQLERDALLHYLLAEFSNRGSDDKVHDFLAEAFSTVRKAGGRGAVLDRLGDRVHHFDFTISVDQAGPMFP